MSFIDLIKQSTYRQSGLIKGIGDDAAVFRHTAHDIVSAVDVFVENIHFSRDTMTPFHIGYRALAANLSDMAAMGATPTYILVAIVVPKGWHSNELEDIFNGIKSLADQHHVDLIGGDTVSGSELTLSITVIGTVDTDHARYRSAARPGDVVFVTGTLGDSQAGYHILTSDKKYTDAAYFVKRHQMPTPRIEFAKGLQHINRLSLNDISDGLANEAREIAEASQVTINLSENAIPISPSFSQFPPTLQHQWKLFGGEDFELLGTVSENDWPQVKKAASKTNTFISKIGNVTANENNKPCEVYLLRDNDKSILKNEGYIHLK